MKNSLVLCLNGTWYYHFSTELEIIKNLINEGNNVWVLTCGQNYKGGCISNGTQSYYRCERCMSVIKAGLSLIKFPKNRILKLQKYPFPIFPEFNNIEDLKTYKLDGINMGFGVVNTCMKNTRDYLFSPEKCKALIQKSLEFAYLVYKNLDIIVKEKNIDSVYIFNGRFAESWTALDYCRQNGIDFYTHECGHNHSCYQLLKNKTFHILEDLKSEINDHWTKGGEDKFKIAQSWFEKKACGKDIWSYTKSQCKNLLPKNFDKNKTNIAVFNSSLDEYSAFDDWKNYICKNENDIVSHLTESFKNDSSKHFYLRIHPNLKNIKTSQMEELRKLAAKNYPNWTFIMPEEEIDTYALIKNADKVLAFTSTAGLESCYWGTPAVLAGRALYEDLDVAYRAEDFEDLVRLLNTKLEPKPKENAYPEAYYMAVFGKEFRNFKNVNKKQGIFNGIYASNLYIRRLKELINFYKITLS